jgi:hypothetical protein
VLLFLRIASNLGLTIGKLTSYCPGPSELILDWSGNPLSIFDLKTEEELL